MSETRLAGPVLGCIADDITGATDLAINLVKGGMRVVQVMEIPTPAEVRSLDCDAIVVALKIRSVPSEEAVSIARAVMKSLQEAGCVRFLYKYCSTFDSTDDGNIGPVAEALLEMVDQPQTVFCPAFPDNGRTVYQGHLFVGDRLLNQCGMEDHPLNPMTDANLLRVLQRQANQDVGGVFASTIEQGASVVTASLAALDRQGVPLVVLDACFDSHLKILAEAVSTMELVTGGSGIAKYLPGAYRDSGVSQGSEYLPSLPAIDGRSFVLSGSCSAATQEQVERFKKTGPSRSVDVHQAVADRSAEVQRIVQWVAETPDAALVYSTADRAAVEQLQREYGAVAAAEAIESTLAMVAQRIVAELGVRRLVVAGGETSGAVANALGVRSLRIGPEICPGVPWTTTDQPYRLSLAFKSGNFGSPDFFSESLAMLDAENRN